MYRSVQRSELSLLQLDVQPEGVVEAYFSGDVNLVYSLRGVLMDYVPSLAMCDGLVEVNTSVMPSDLLIHRVGMIPLRVDTPDGAFLMDTMTPFQECDCGSSEGSHWGCQKCSVSFVLDVFNGAVISRSVMSSELVKGPSHFPVHVMHAGSDEEGAVAVEAGLPPDKLALVMDAGQGYGVEVVTLGPGQHVKAIFRAQLGHGAVHARFCVVSAVAIRQRVKVEVDMEVAASMPPEAVQALVDTFPDLVTLVELGPKGQRVLAPISPEAWVVEDPLDVCDDLDDFEEAWGVNGVMKITGQSYYRLEVEGTGAVPAKDLIPVAAEVLRRRTQALIGALLEGLQRPGVIKVPSCHLEPEVDLLPPPGLK